MATSDEHKEATMMAEPQAEHRWLHRLLGEWSFEGEAAMGPDKPPEKWQGTETVRSLGGLWIFAEGKGEMPGGGVAESVMTLGYDPQRKRFTGTFIASMMTHMWHYDGKLDAAEKVLTLDTEGPDMAVPGKMAKYRDVVEVKSDDHRVLSSHLLGEDGTWQKFMTAHYRRKK